MTTTTDTTATGVELVTDQIDPAQAHVAWLFIDLAQARQLDRTSLARLAHTSSVAAFVVSLSRHGTVQTFARTVDGLLVRLSVPEDDGPGGGRAALFARLGNCGPAAAYAVAWAISSASARIATPIGGLS